MSILLKQEDKDIIKIYDDADRYLEAQDKLYSEFEQIRQKWKSQTLQDEIDKIRDILK